VERTYRESELIAILGEPKLRDRRRVVTNAGWVELKEGQELPTTPAFTWDCSGIFDTWKRLKSIVDDAVWEDNLARAAEASGVMAQLLIAACCLASRAPDGTDSWSVFSACNRHRAIFSEPTA
jgi:hypothetical protein